MEGLLPFLVHAIKKRRQQADVYRCHSNNSMARSYHLLHAEGSVADDWTRSEFQPPPAVDVFTAGSDHFTSLGWAGDGVMHRGFASGSKVKN